MSSTPRGATPPCEADSCKFNLKIFPYVICFIVNLNITIFRRKEVSEFFDRMDRDYDGRLTYGEFMGEETALEKVFKNMDKDGDGTVSKEVSEE